MVTFKLSFLKFAYLVLIGIVILPMPTTYSSSGATDVEQDEQVAFYQASAKVPFVGDENTAKAYAIQVALKNAILEAAQDITGSGDASIMSAGFTDYIGSSYKDFVSDYSVESCGISNGEYQVVLEVEVRVSALSEELFIQQVPFPKPRVMVIVSEKHNNMPTSQPNTETTIIQGLVEAGFDVVDQAQSESIREDNIVREAVYGDPQKLLLDDRISKQRTEIIIIGESISESADFAGGLYACRANVVIKAIQVDTAKILAAYNAQASGKDTTETLASASAHSSAGKDACKVLIPKLFIKTASGSNSIVLYVYNIKFEELLQFEQDLLRNVSGVTRVDRGAYSSSNAEIEVSYGGTGQNLAEAIVLKPFTKYKFEVSEFSENRIDMKITGIDNAFTPPTSGAVKPPLIVDTSETNKNLPVGSAIVPTKTEAAYSGNNPIDQDNDAIGLSITPFDDPYNTGLGVAAANTLGDKLNKLRFFDYIASEEIPAINEVVTERINWFDIDPGSFAGSKVQAELDWLIIGSINNISFTISYDEGTKGKDKYGKEYYITKPHWIKSGAMEISVKLIDLKTYGVILTESHSSWNEQTAPLKEALATDEYMSNNLLNAALLDAYIGILKMCYDHFNVEGYIMAKDPNQKGRGVINLTRADGIYVDMPLVVYMVGEKIVLPDGKEIGGWKELCKSTVKEIDEDGGYSFIEMDDKWFKWIGFGKGNNKVVPTFMIDKSEKEDFWDLFK